MGCWADDPNARVYDEREKFKWSNSPLKCAAYCTNLGYEFFALQASKQCYCGDFNYKTYGSLNIDQCKANICSEREYNNLYCGGPHALLVYHIDAVDEAALPATLKALRIK